MPKSRTDFQRNLDGELTKIINDIQSVQALMTKGVKELTTELGKDQAIKQNARFFVKGGNALKLIRINSQVPDQTPWSDWDTQIIINPNLSIQDWYSLFRKIQKIIINRILTMQVEWEVATQRWTNQQGIKFDNKIYNLKVATQLNFINTLSTPILHPLQTFDNANNVLGNYPNDFDQTFKLTQLEKGLRKIPLNAWQMFINGWNGANKHIIEKYFAYGKVSGTDMGILASENDINNVPALIDSDSRFNQVNLSQKLKFFQDFKNFLSQYPTQSFTRSSFTANSLIKDFYLFRMVVRYTLSNYLLDGTPANNNTYKVPLRAELLDISIPRRDTAEAIHQYKQVEIYPIIANVFIPTWQYHVEENVMLIVEVLEGRSGSPGKIKKRISRGLEAINQIDQKLFNKTAQSLLDQNNDLYLPWLNNIKNKIQNVLGAKFILLLLLYSLENDFKLSKIISNKIQNNLTNIFENLVLNIKNQYNSTTKIIPDTVQKQLTFPEQIFIGTIELSRHISNMFSQTIDSESLSNVGKLSKLFTAKNIPNILGPQMSALLLMQHLEPKLFVSSKNYIYPFIDIYVSPMKNLNLNNLKTAFKEIQSQSDSFSSSNSVNDWNDNTIYIIKKGNIQIKISHNHIIANRNHYQIINGRSLMKNNTIIIALNQLIANSKNIHVVHWLDGLRKDFQKALTTF